MTDASSRRESLRRSEERYYRKPGAGNDVAGLLKLLGIDHRRDHLPGRISGGEMQRVAIARSLIDSPEILLADEPTGNLDTKRSLEIVRILKDLTRSAGLTVIMVSHNPELARMADRQFEMRDGKISERENLNWNMSERRGPERVLQYVTTG